jgi:hypothetical protein
LQLEFVSIAKLDYLMGIVLIYLLYLTEKILFYVVKLWKLLNFAIEKKGNILMIEQNQ